MMPSGHLYVIHLTFISIGTYFVTMNFVVNISLKMSETFFRSQWKKPHAKRTSYEEDMVILLAHAENCCVHTQSGLCAQQALHTAPRKCCAQSRNLCCAVFNRTEAVFCENTYFQMPFLESSDLRLRCRFFLCDPYSGAVVLIYDTDVKVLYKL